MHHSNFTHTHIAFPKACTQTPPPTLAPLLPLAAPATAPTNCCFPAAVTHGHRLAHNVSGAQRVLRFCLMQSLTATYDSTKTMQSALGSVTLHWCNADLDTSEPQDPSGTAVQSSTGRTADFAWWCLPFPIWGVQISLRSISFEFKSVPYVQTSLSGPVCCRL